MQNERNEQMCQREEQRNQTTSPGRDLLYPRGCKTGRRRKLSQNQRTTSLFLDASRWSNDADQTASDSQEGQ